VLPHKPWPTWHVFIALTDDEVAFLQDRVIEAECLSLQGEEFLLTAVTRHDGALTGHLQADHNGHWQSRICLKVLRAEVYILHYNQDHM